MRFNVAFIVLASLSLVLAQDKHAQSSSSAQAPTGGTPVTSTAGGAGDAGAMLSSLPKCFTECATKAATSATVGCTGLTDVACICSKPQFSNATMVCISSSGQNDCGALAQNRTALQQGQKVFEGICKSAGAAGASGSSGSMAGMPGMSNSTSASGSAPASGSSSTSSTSAPPAGHNGAVIQHVATGSIVFTALLAGAATLL